MASRFAAAIRVSLLLGAGILPAMVPSATVSAAVITPPNENDNFCTQTCDMALEYELGRCWDQNFASPNNGAYAICVNSSYLGWRLCRNGCS